MATLVLGTLGGLLGPVGRIAGGIVGSFIDQQIFGSASDPVEGPSIDELRVPTFDEGQGAPWVAGTECRVPGMILWVSPLRKVKRSNDSGGKKGQGSSAAYYEYFVDLALAFARGTVTPVEPVKKIWGQGSLLYEVVDDLQVESTLISATAVTEKKTIDIYCVNKPYIQYIDYTHTPGGGSPTNVFEEFESGKEVSISGYSNAVNNGNFHVVSVELDADGVAGKSRMRVLRCQHDFRGQIGGSCTDYSSCVAGVTEAAGNTVTITQVKEDRNPAQLEAVTQYNGSLSQSPDSLMEAVEGAGNVPAYRGTVYVVLKNLNVTKWGGTLPAFEGLVNESETTRSVASTLGLVLERNGKLTSADYDASAVTGDIRGLVQVGMKAPIEALRHLLMVYDLEVQARGVIEGGSFKYKLVFIEKANAETRTVADDDRGCRAAGDDSDELIAITKNDGSSMPEAVHVSFLDPARDHQPGSQSYKRSSAAVQSEIRISLPLTLTASNAIALAKKVLYQMRLNERTQVTVTLPPTYIDLAEADLIQVNDQDGEGITARVTSVDRGANGLLEVEALQEFVQVYSEPATGETTPG